MKRMVKMCAEVSPLSGLRGNGREREGRREIMGGSWQKKVEKWATKKFKNNQRGRGGGGREMMMRM